MSNLLAFGVGINDADYTVQPTIEGVRTWCPFYRKWSSMLTRCYSKASHVAHPTYVGCTVCAEWLVFSNFKSWMESQEWQGKHLDKDVILIGNTVYSPSSCAFIDQMTNNFTNETDRHRGDLPLGVTYNKASGKIRAQCSNPFTKKKDFLGNFETPEKAHLAWKKRKHELALQLAELQTDDRVAAALRVRYL